jgi:hypothetical protein
MNHLPFSEKTYGSAKAGAPGRSSGCIKRDKPIDEEGRSKLVDPFADTQCKNSNCDIRITTANDSLL